VSITTGRAKGMNYMRITIYTAIILLVCTYVSFAEETKPNFKIALAINCSDEGTNKKTESYLSRELRSLGDVDIVDSGEECKLTAIVVKDMYKSGEVLGYSLAVLCTIPYICDNQLFDHAGSHRLYTTGKDDLRYVCEEIILNFEDDYLKEKRKARAKVKNK